MRRTARWSDARRVTVQGIALLAGCLAALAVHEVVTRIDLDDRLELALCGTMFATLALGAVVALRTTRAVRERRARYAAASLGAGFLAVLVAFAWTDYPDASIALADLVAPAQAADAGGTLVLGPGGTDIRLSGDIAEGTAERLRALLGAHPTVSRIHLTSDGGLADEGQAVGEVIAAHKLATYVPDYCVSACTLAFVAGRERIVMEGARLGFHRPFYEGVLGQNFAGDASVQRAAYLAAGLTPSFVDAALQVAPDDVWFPTTRELLGAHVATRVVDRYRLPDSMLDGAATRQGARAALLRNFPALTAIAARAPSAVSTLAARYLDAYESGHSEGADVDEVKAAVRAVLTITLSRADDPTLRDLARYLSRAMREAEGREDVCVAIGEHVDLLLGQLYVAGASAEADSEVTGLVAAALRSAGARPAPSPDGAVAPVSTCAGLRAQHAQLLETGDVTPLRARLAIESRSAALMLAGWLKTSP